MATDEQIEQAAKRRGRVLDAIKNHITDKGYPPTLTDLAQLLDVDRETIVVDVRTLAAGGYIEVDKGIVRGIRVVGYRVVLVPEA